jgi:hypothetical protein
MEFLYFTSIRKHLLINIFALPPPPCIPKYNFYRVAHDEKVYITLPTLKICRKNSKSVNRTSENLGKSCLVWLKNRFLCRIHGVQPPSNVDEFQHWESKVYTLNVYTVQNPRRRVVSVKTSQMRTICTLIWRESCLLVYIFTSAFILGWCIFVDMHFRQVGN